MAVPDDTPAPAAPPPAPAAARRRTLAEVLEDPSVEEVFVEADRVAYVREDGGGGGRLLARAEVVDLGRP